MNPYNAIFILTNIMYIFAIYKLLHTFFSDSICNKFIEITTLIFSYFILSATIFITRIQIVMLLINLILVFIITFSYKSSFQKKIIATFSIVSILLFIELIISLIYGALDLKAFNNSTFNSISILIFLRILTMIIAVLINRYDASIKKDFTIPKVYYYAFFIILLGTLYLFISLLENKNLTLTRLIFNGIILILVNMVMVIVDEKIYSSLVLENEKKLLKQQNEAYENQTTIINQSNEAIRLFKHDMKNHFFILDEMYKHNKFDEIKHYIDKIIKNGETEMLCKTNNFVIDSIVNFKLRNIETKNIEVYVNANIPHTINIMAYDLTTILSNLLDNAITACEKSQKKILSIKIISKMNNLLIFIDNSYDGNLIIENDKFKTTKCFSTSHGLGLSSIEKTLELYDGELRTKYTNDVFSVSVLIPYE